MSLPEAADPGALPLPLRRHYAVAVALAGAPLDPSAGTLALAVGVEQPTIVAGS